MMSVSDGIVVVVVVVVVDAIDNYGVVVLQIQHFNPIQGEYNEDSLT